MSVPLAGILGAPVGSSRMPALYSYWLRTQGVPGYFVPMEVAQVDLEQVIRALPRMGFVGVNVTIPHKEKVLAIADLVTDRAALIGAANMLIFRKDGKIHADNTDGYGFIENLKTNAPHWSAAAGPAAVFGAGGGARAIVTALIDQGCTEIRLANRTKTRAEALHDEFGGKVVVYDWVQAGSMLDGAMTVVNTTSLGMEGKSEFRVPLDALSPHAVVTDLVYTPVQTAFLERAAEAGCTTVDGLGMLLYQAVPAFERWFGFRPTVDDGLRRAVMNH